MSAPAAPPVHDLLLAVAGRVDDDLLAWARELVAVGEDGQAVELVTAALAGDRVPLPAPVRAALVAANRAARTDLDADRVLAPAGADAAAHRFDPAAAPPDRIAAALAGLPARRLAGCRLHLTWRRTPAGAAPGPVPHPVLLVEVEPDRSTEALAYQLAVELERAGASASVEVFSTGSVLPAYHATALRAARELATRSVAASSLTRGSAPADRTGRAGRAAAPARRDAGGGPTTSPQPVLRAVPEVEEPARPEHARPEPVRPEPVRPEPMRSEPMRSEPMRPEPARSEPTRPEPVRAERVRPEPVRPDPRPEPVRSEPAHSEPVQLEPVRSEVPRSEVPRSEEPPAEPRWSSRSGSAPAANPLFTAKTEILDGAAARSAEPSLFGSGPVRPGGDPLSDPLQTPLLDAVLEPPGRDAGAADHFPAPSPAVEDRVDRIDAVDGFRSTDLWTDEWRSGDWAVPTGPSAAPSAAPSPSPSPSPSPAPAASDELPRRSGRRRRPEPDDEPAEPDAAAPTSAEPPTAVVGPPAETFSMLSGAERDLLAQLQAELAAREGGAAAGHGTSGNGTNGTNGKAPHPPS